jgi:hypothetical protein
VQDYDGDEPTGQLQMLVNADMARILEYREDHRDEYGGRWINRDDRTYAVTFTNSLERHEASLRTVLNLPERLRIQRCLHIYAELSALCERLPTEDWDLSDLDQNGKPAVSGFGPDEKEGVVRVRVQRSRADVAAKLSSKYGSLIAVQEVNDTTLPI